MGWRHLVGMTVRTSEEEGWLSEARGMDTLEKTC